MGKNKKGVTKGFSLVILFCLFHVHLVFSQNPNVLFIIADDLGIDSLDPSEYGASANIEPVTPNIQSLKSSGISFLNAWATPQCTTTRAQIMSGKYGIKTGVRDVPGNLDLVHESIFTYLNNNLTTNYAKAVIGKWHISQPSNPNHPYQHGVDHYEGVIAGTIGDYYSWSKVDQNGNSSQINQYVTEHFTDDAIDWIADQTDPWFLWLAHIAPHAPFHTPPSGTYSQTNLNGNRRKYIASIESLDYYIGELLNSMDQATRDNTIIIFIGDNGTPNRVLDYFPDGHSKGSMYEGGLRVPMIISGYGVTRQGEVENGLVQVNDIYATIIELLSNDLDGGIYNSYSLKDALTTQNAITRPYVYSDYIESNGVEYWAIRNDTYKLIENENGGVEFYNLVNDLPEVNDLVGSMTSAEMEIFNELQAEGAIIRSSWSCADDILNGTETTIDDCLCSTSSKVTTYLSTGWDNGAPNLHKCAIIDSDYTTSSFQAHNLVVNATKNLTIDPSTYIEIEKDIENNGTIIVEPTGSVVQLKNDAQVVGTGIFTTNIETTSIQDTDRFTYFSSPSSAGNINAFSGFSTAHWDFDGASQEWNYLGSNEASAAMTAGKGYAIQGGTGVEQVTFTGAFNNGLITQSLFFDVYNNIAGNYPDPAATDDDSNFMGNPYPSAISADDLIMNNDISNIYIWTHESPLDATPTEEDPWSGDDYIDCVIGTCTSAPSGGANATHTGLIASGQGFFALATDTGNLTFDNSMRRTTGNDQFRSLDDKKLWLNMISDRGYQKQIALTFTTNGSEDFDTKYESKSFGNNYGLGFYSLNGIGDRLTINDSGVLEQERTIPLGYYINSNRVNNVEIGINHFTGLENITIYLKDNVLNSIHDLKQNNYTFRISQTGITDDRFELILRNQSLNTSEVVSTEIITIINDDTMTIETSDDNTISKLEIYDALGRVLINKNSIQSHYIDLNISGISNGILFIKVYISDGQILHQKLLHN